MVRVIWTEPALNDLKDTIDYIAMDSLVYATRLGTHIVEAPRRLEQFPNIGRVVPEFDDERFRELIYGSYRIIYHIREDACFIISVIHASRDIMRHLKPGDWIVE